MAHSIKKDSTIQKNKREFKNNYDCVSNMKIKSFAKNQNIKDLPGHLKSILWNRDKTIKLIDFDCSFLPQKKPNAFEFYPELNLKNELNEIPLGKISIELKKKNQNMVDCEFFFKLLIFPKLILIQQVLKNILIGLIVSPMPDSLFYFIKKITLNNQQSKND